MTFLKELHKPDILDCIAHLSSDEVFTPPKLVNEMLDMLPPELFRSTETKFLDPGCKSGVFLREIAKRLIEGEKELIPDLEKRIRHIFTNQLYGLAITELTGLLARRSTYCSKKADGEYSICTFSTPDGNIDYTRTEHVWENGKCTLCGASQSQYDRGDILETHAYSFIHCDEEHNKTVFKRLKDMKFDVIIGNPPYQLSDGGAQASASPIYQLFVEQAKRLNPRYLTMIIPSRWMTGGKGLDAFRSTMIHDKHFKTLHDFADSNECFRGVDIKGGVCYFLWTRDSEQKCDIYRHDINGVSHSKRYLVEEGDDIFIRCNQLIPIKDKVQAKQEESFMSLVSAMKPYGLRGDVFEHPIKYDLPKMGCRRIKDGYEVVGLCHLRRESRFIPPDYPIPQRNMLHDYKIFMTRNYGCGEIGEVPATPVLATPGMLCTETFIQIGPFKTQKEMENCFSYIKTKFFRCMVGIRKQDQGAGRAVYKYVPMQDFSEPWTDAKLYKKYGLTKDEINFIESMIKPME
ncbi:MAG: Eco57I restriction-modification methylase domain-containing protein [Elusimicrobiaceae bacterium]|nr:Eco57I restriction-modification methylase domain-containing protein [Elusimicrobiaceae bacterium]